MKLIDPYELGLDVTKMSGVEAQCLCPFHVDHKPSASFNMETGLFHCFACGESANVHKLVSFLGSRVLFNDVDEISKIVPHSEGEDEWTWVLRCEQAIGNEYLKSRRVTDEEVRRYDIRQFKEGIAFISTDIRGQPIGAQLRLYHGERRYIILGQKPRLWPLSTLRDTKQGSIIFVEGVFGSINARRFGLSAFAVMGVASSISAVGMTNGFRRKVIVFDDDEAGKLSAMKILSLGIGFEAYCPGAEADEVGADFWADLQATRHIDNYLTFAHESGASRESLAAVSKFIVKTMPRKSRWKIR